MKCKMTQVQDLQVSDNQMKFQQSSCNEWSRDKETDGQKSERNSET